MDLREQLALLKQLQDVDSEFAYIELSRGELPELIKREGEELILKDANLKALGNQLEINKKSQSQLEIDIQVSKDKIVKYQNQRYQVTTNREYEAINTEIESQEQNIEDYEKQLIELLREEEEVREQLKELVEEVDDLKMNIKNKTSELEEADRLSKDKELELKKKKEEISPKIEHSLMRKYQRVSQSNSNKIGVVNIKRGACGACFRKLMPQIVVDVRAMDKINCCTSCGVILLAEEENN
ncbi:hypothetical protein IT568_04420 [bacterium]|nr:hypothetical protein [bacterium]